MVNFVKLSKAMAKALRHKPWLFEVELDADGWTSIDALLASLRRSRLAWEGLSRDDLAAIIAQSDKRRYEIDADRIRALYGHSISAKIAKTPAYHQTCSIMARAGML